MSGFSKSNLRAALASLQPVHRGMPVRQAVSAARLNALQDAVAGLYAGENLSAGRGLRVDGGASAGVRIRDLRRALPKKAKAGALQLTYVRPPYVTPSGAAPAEGVSRFWVTMGLVNGKLPVNYDVTIEAAANVDLFVALEVVPSENVDRFEVAEVNVVWDEAPQVTGEWGTNGEFPNPVYVPLGWRHGASGKLENWGRGIVEVRSVLSNVEVGLTTKFHRSLSYVRMENVL